jgi:hypothetical protein
MLVTAAYALSRDWAIIIPAYAPTGGLIAALLIGGAAGLYPAVRAARLSPNRSPAHGLMTSRGPQDVGRESLAPRGTPRWGRRCDATQAAAAASRTRRPSCVQGPPT